MSQKRECLCACPRVNTSWVGGPRKEEEGAGKHKELSSAGNHRAWGQLGPWMLSLTPTRAPARAVFTQKSPVLSGRHPWVSMSSVGVITQELKKGLSS